LPSAAGDSVVSMTDKLPATIDILRAVT
jgi:hypothetical protein